MKKSQEKGKKAPQKQFPDKKKFKKLIAEGKKQGYLTYDQIYAFLPEDQQTAEQFDDTIMLLDDQGIKVVDGSQMVKGQKARQRKKRRPRPQRLCPISERSRILSRCTCAKWGWLPC